MITAQASAAGAAEPGTPGVDGAARRARRCRAHRGRAGGGAEGIAAAAGWRDVLRVVGLLRGLPRLEQLLPALGLDGGALADRSWDEVVDSRALSRIRGLLAKAESTDFEAEAEALTAKAQELMARHAIDTAMLGRHAPTPAPPRGAGAPAAPRRPARRGQGRHRAGRRVGERGAGGAAAGYGIATLVGMPGDLDAVELLVTSLLLQAGRGLADAVRRAGSRGGRRPIGGASCTPTPSASRSG